MDLVEILVNRLQQMLADFIRVLPQLGIALVVLMLTWLAAKFARRIAERLLRHTDIRGTLINLFETVTGVIIWLIGLMIASSIVLPGVTPANLLALVGLGSVAVGFAFKDIFENFLAGILIMLRRKMRIGDMIECEDVSGKVEHITLRDTYLRHLSNELVLVPNAYLFKNPVKILTDSSTRRHQVEVGVGYDVDLDEAHGVIEAAVRRADGVDSEQRIDIFAKEFGDSSVNFLVRWWAGSKPYEAHASRDAVLRSIKRALDDAGMEIPYPYRTLTFKEALPIALERKLASEQDKHKASAVELGEDKY
ncbi:MULTISPECIES: mechanosensitive ion channel family protein [unclassified Sphingobium]|uniref:mechanosensitive ion channel family protein n=1 Tax=unclassified Sphingobium TaxID=2611147 RepID=UPI000D1677A5|nr:MULTISPECIES: mechanosensitive ion channel [unclassified Sphingobium]MBG6119879.1 small-conductance mechanosensitive channel [Sphingobium sp. JAI105]PSO10173.1 mechanosensitive ion channel protein MscS [Sphingobium sp. AEW4]TWC98979.1 small-conductance mechanosensitive channel [Sphingobium sp. AEW010]TWD18462.1 small-conductance mechanosensitive channel [Sphingobium sp. AEW013]TWD21266.1 small-conductance mechanosensitive channel [Sphingobium sp. AEW001]